MSTPLPGREVAITPDTSPSEITAILLDRPRHAAAIAAIRKLGAAVSLISDGDVAGVIHCAEPKTGIDIYLGIGGAPEGVLAAAALRCIGGQMQGRLLFRNDDERERARKIGVKDLNRKYSMLDLAHGDVMFAATGVTDGTMLKGVRYTAAGAETSSIVMRSRSGTIRYLSTRHHFEEHPIYDRGGKLR